MFTRPSRRSLYLSVSALIFAIQLVGFFASRSGIRHSSDQPVLEQTLVRQFPALRDNLAGGAEFAPANEQVNGRAVAGLAVKPASAAEPEPPAGLAPVEREAWVERARRAGSSIKPFFPARYRSPFTVEGEGVKAVLRPLGAANPAAEVVNGKIVYRNAYRATDSLHAVKANRSEEFLYLASADAPRRFEYEISSAAEIRLEAGAVLFRNKAGRALRIEAPWVIDARGNRHESAARWELGRQGEGGSRLLALTLDAQGLAYPLVIDPSWSSTGSMSVARSGHTATLLANGKVLVVGGNASGAAAELYDPTTGTWSAASSPTAARSNHTATMLTNGKVLVAGGTAGGTTAEIYDPATGNWAATGPMQTPRDRHFATRLGNGRVLVVAGYNGSNTLIGSAEIFNPDVGSWTSTASLSVPRSRFVGTLLASGKVIVAGGRDGSGLNALASCEVYDPSNGTWRPAGALANGRSDHALAPLADGKVLVAGGNNSAGNRLTSAEVYDPANNTWSGAGDLCVARAGHSATTLAGGRVLVAGGEGSSGYLLSTELYDPATGTWTISGNLGSVRAAHTALLLANGKVLVAGGRSNATAAIASAELFEPDGESWNAANSMAVARESHTATLLQNGKVLVVGGNADSPDAEIYDPATGTWSATSAMVVSRHNHSATLLQNGKVLVAGGTNAVVGAELYNPANDTWSLTGSLVTQRSDHFATLLADGRVLVAGGRNITNTQLYTAEIYDPGTGAWAATGAMNVIHLTIRGVLLSDGRVLVAGGRTSSSVNALDACEIFDPNAGTWSDTGSLNTARSNQTLTLLNDGTVLAAGGVDDANAKLSSVELYNPTSGVWIYTAGLCAARSDHTATLLANGKVLVAGGEADNSFLKVVELFDPTAGAWSGPGDLTAPRAYHTATLLTSGQALIVGGQNDFENYSPVRTAELYSECSAPAVTTQPASQVKCTTGAASFGVVVSGTGPFQYQWRKGGTPLSSGGNVSGATTATLNIGSLTTNDAGSYDVVVIGACGTITSDPATLTVNSLHSITAPPQSLTRCEGTPAGFSVAVSGTGPFTYQWRRNSNNINGANADTFNIAAVTANDAGSYDVVVTGTCGSVTSTAATLTVNPPTSINSQPASLAVCENSPAIFSVTPSGTGPFTYQWRKNSSNISGATGNTFSIASATQNDAASYDVVVTGTCSAVTSNAATLTINSPTSISSQPVSQTVCEGAPANFSVMPSGTGPFTYQWRKNSNNINGATSGAFSITTVSANDAGSYDVVVTGACSSVTSNAATLAVNPATSITAQPAPQAVCFNASASFSVTPGGTGPFTYQWRKNSNNINGATSSTFSITAATQNDAGNYDVVVTGACSAATSNTAALTINASTSISTQPASQTVCEGASANFSVAPSGTGPFTYQWRRNSSNINGATGSTFSIATVSANDAASYDVVVTGACSTVTSNVATLTVNPTTSISSQPVPQTVCLNAPAGFSVTATGTGPFTYQWRKNGNNISGATGNTFSIASATQNDAGNYDVVVTGACSAATSNAAALAVNSLTSITAQPESQTVCLNAAASFSVTPSGTGPFTYQWRRNSNNINGATAGTYTINSTTQNDAASYDVIVTGACGSATSSAATLTISTSPTITAHPASQSLTAGPPASFSVSVTGIGPFTYQWRRNSNNINGATSGTYTINSTTVNDSGSYDVVVTGACGSATSNAAQLTVLSSAPVLGLSWLNFDGVTDNKGDYVTVDDANDLDLGNNFTVEAWVRWRGAPAGCCNAIISKPGRDGGGITTTGFRLDLSNGRPTLAFNDTLGPQAISGPTDFPVNQWTHVAASKAGRIVKLYVNGALVGTTDLGYNLPVATDASQNTSTKLVIGREFTSGMFDRAFGGEISEVRAWNLVRTDAEIEDNYNNSLAGTESGLVLLLPMNEGSGVTASDRTGNHHNGSLGGGNADNQPVWSATEVYREAGQPALPFKRLTITDPDSTTLENTTVRISTNLAAGDTLAFTSQNGITGSFNAGTGILGLSGSASVASWERALRSISFSNTSPNPSTATRTLLAVVDDGQSISNVASVSLTFIPAPTVSINSVSVAEGNSGTTNAAFTVTLSAATDQDVAVSYATASGTATAGSDYASTSGTLVIPAGQTSGTITVPVSGDCAVESDETFTVALSNPVSAKLGSQGSNGTGTITNDDVAGTIQLGAATYSVTEGGAATITVSRSGGGAETSVNYAITAGTGVQGADYTAAAYSGTLTFSCDELTRTITIQAVDDNVFESNETVNIALSNPTGGAALGSTSSAVLTITDNDTKPTVAVNNVSVTEGSSGTTDAVFTVTLSNPSSSANTVSYQTADASAVAPGDYTAAGGSLTFNPGETGKNITIKVIGDTLDENDETFTLSLSDGQGGLLAQGTGTIIDDDDPPALLINDVTVTEGNSGTASAVFTVSLSAASAKSVTVNVATADGTATAPGDYTALSTTLAFNPGQTSQTVTVQVKGDTAYESDETFLVNLSNATNATIARNRATGTITNDDPALVATSTVVTSSLNPATLNQAVTFTATVSATSQQSGAPTGTVIFRDGATTLGGGTLNASGKATLVASALAAGSHAITAEYGGDSSFVASTSATLTQVVNSDCAFTVSPPTQKFTEAGGNFTVSVSTTSGCYWTAISNVPWISIGDAGFKLGDGSASVTVEALTGGVVSRTGTLVVAGRTVTVVQGRNVTTVSAASYDDTAVASEGIAAAFGLELAPMTEVATAVPLPETLAGIKVKITDSDGVERFASLLFVSPLQINFVLPAGLAPGPAVITVTSGSLQNGAGVVQVARVAPSLFTADATGQGPPAALALRVRSDSTSSYEPVAQFDQAQNKFLPVPIDLGTAPGATTDELFLVLFGTGARARTSLADVTVKIGGDDAEVLYAGVQGGFVGLDQVNVRIPRSLIGRGDVDVTLTVEGRTANTVRINIR